MFIHFKKFSLLALNLIGLGLSLSAPLHAQADPFAPAPYVFFGRSPNFDEVDAERVIQYANWFPGFSERDAKYANRIKMQVMGAPIFVRQVVISTFGSDEPFIYDFNRTYQVGEMFEASLPFYPAQKLGSIEVRGVRQSKFATDVKGFVRAWYTPSADLITFDVGKGKVTSGNITKTSVLNFNLPQKIRLLTITAWGGNHKIHWFKFRTTDGVVHTMDSFTNQVLENGRVQTIEFPNGVYINQVQFKTQGAPQIFPWNDPPGAGQLWIRAKHEY